MTNPCRRCAGTGHEPDWTHLGKRIRAARKEMGIGVRELARRAGCSAAYVVDLEYGRRSGLKGTKARKVLTIVGLWPYVHGVPACGLPPHLLETGKAIVRDIVEELQDEAPPKCPTSRFFADAEEGE